jgi:hypothetical protein
MQIVAGICQNRTAGKDQFFQKSAVAQIKKCKTNESYNNLGHVHKKSQIKTTFWEFSRIFTAKHINLFRDNNNFPKSYLLPIRGYSWNKNKIKIIRRVHYSSNNFQDSTKRKITEKKILGYLPRELSLTPLS